MTLSIVQISFVACLQLVAQYAVGGHNTILSYTNTPALNEVFCPAQAEDQVFYGRLFTKIAPQLFYTII
jgi:hypothetical protein